MKAPTIFGLVVRSFGVFLVYETVHTLIGLVNVASAQFPHDSSVTISFATLLNTVLLAGAAVWFLKGAPPLQKVAYPSTEESGTNSIAIPAQKPIHDGPPCVACGEKIPTGATKCPHCGWTQP